MNCPAYGETPKSICFTHERWMQGCKSTRSNRCDSDGWEPVGNSHRCLGTMESKPIWVQSTTLPPMCPQMTPVFSVHTCLVKTDSTTHAECKTSLRVAVILSSCHMGYNHAWCCRGGREQGSSPGREQPDERMTTIIQAEVKRGSKIMHGCSGCGTR